MAGEIVTTGRPLELYNSLGRRLEPFVSSADVVGLYSCGPTVYAYPHLGNLRAYVFADTLRRALRWKAHPVRHVVNITDVGHAVADTELGEDKLEAASARERRSVEEIAAYYTGVFMEDLAKLRILPADVYPRASTYVEQMIEFAEVLEARGYTYRLPSGLYFDTGKLPGYGELARIDVTGQREGARVEHVEGRRTKTDFAVWRAEPTGRPRSMRWESPWGWGAPGWHLECSVMSIGLLGSHFDIHTGGVDHRQIHHVNEIAQSEAYLADGRPWVRYWLHNEFLQLDAEKMAKSSGGAPRLGDLVETGYHPLSYRLFLLGSQYRAQVDFTTAAISAAQATLRRLIGRVRPLRPLPVIESYDAALAGAGTDPIAAALLGRIDAAISDDLGSPRVLALLQEVLREPGLTEAGRRVLLGACEGLLGLGLDDLEPEDLERRGRADLDAEEVVAVERLVAERTQAREARDWPRADRIRDELAAMGVQVTDTPDGPVWALG